eukprot:ANDGO_04919.mRNA.2 hypothetical protein
MFAYLHRSLYSIVSEVACDHDGFRLAPGKTIRVTNAHSVSHGKTMYLLPTTDLCVLLSENSPPSPEVSKPPSNAGVFRVVHVSHTGMLVREASGVPALCKHGQLFRLVAADDVLVIQNCTLVPSQDETAPFDLMLSDHSTVFLSPAGKPAIVNVPLQMRTAYGVFPVMEHAPIPKHTNGEMDCKLCVPRLRLCDILDKMVNLSILVRIDAVAISSASQMSMTAATTATTTTTVCSPLVEQIASELMDLDEDDWKIDYDFNSQSVPSTATATCHGSESLSVSSALGEDRHPEPQSYRLSDDSGTSWILLWNGADLVLGALYWMENLAVDTDPATDALRLVGGSSSSALLCRSCAMSLDDDD